MSSKSRETPQPGPLFMQEKKYDKICRKILDEAYPVQALLTRGLKNKNKPKNRNRIIIIPQQ